MITKVCFFPLLQAIDAFDTKKFHFIILKYKYFELLCIKAEAPNPSKEGAVDELVKVRICFLLRLEKKDWQRFMFACSNGIIIYAVCSVWSYR